MAASTDGPEEKREENAERRGRYARAAGKKPAPLTVQKVALLRHLAECRLLSLPQLARLACPSEQSARRHMRELFDAGLADIVAVPRAALAPAEAANDASLLHGSAPNVYVPTKAGLRLLADAGHLSEEAARRPLPSYGPKNSLFLAHELAVRDVRVWLEIANAAEPVRRVLRWEDGREAAIPVPGAPVVRPDAWFVWQLGIMPLGVEAAGAESGARPLILAGLVELDRGTERGGLRWNEKLDAYAGLFANRAALVAVTGYVNARVLVIAPSAARRDGLAALIMESAHEKGLPPDLPARFWLAEKDALERTDLAEPLWRRPGHDELWPLVSAETLARAQK